MACISPLPQYYSNNFSMHGLWPAKSDGDTLPVSKDKTTPPISDQVFDKLEAKLDIWWAVIDQKWSPKTDFWGSGGRAIEAYFLDGMKARQGINLLQILHKDGLSFNTDYTKKDVVRAVHAQLGVENVLYILPERPVVV